MPKGLETLADWAIPEPLAIHVAHAHDLAALGVAAEGARRTLRMPAGTTPNG